MGYAIQRYELSRAVLLVICHLDRTMRIETLPRCLTIAPIGIDQSPTSNFPYVALQYGGKHRRVTGNLIVLEVDLVRQLDSLFFQVSFAAQEISLSSSVRVWESLHVTISNLLALKGKS